MSVAEREHGRERNKRATRRALRAATLELGLRRGLAEVSVEEIARRAGVSPRTFFNYFDTKEDAALIELFVVTDEELAVFTAGNGGAGVWADLTRILAADVERAEADGQDLPRYMQLHARHPVLAARQMGQFSSFLGRLADAVATRTGDNPQTRLRAEVIAGSCITAVRVGLSQWAAQGWRSTAAEHVTAAFALFDPAFGDTA
ncbi:MAG: TetR/AcrR family transcriptional regulator [Pseudonocardia sp.]|nr:TetR/AcrR family transcriptional regulator [Pseudonocardia sp.]